MAVPLLPSGTDEVVCLRPGGPLAGRLVDCAGYRERLATTVLRREIPSSVVVVVLAFGDPVEVLRSPMEGSGTTLTSLVAGLHDRPAVTGIGGSQHGVQIWLSPLEAYSIFGVPMHEISNAFLDLEALLGRTGSLLVERLAEAPSWPLRFEALGTALAGLISSGPQADPAVEWAWRRLRATSGVIRIGALAEQLGWSRRHLVRRFHEQIGLPPKTVGRILRFERALALLEDRGRAFSDVASDAGYSDQAHLSREFRALVQCSPGEFAASLRPASPGRRAMSHFFKL
ncbi:MULTISPECIES: helix-turn-helix domain-containing protein [Nonomuraea]|uniref:Helix-turn-helix domain-containing protein n=1 Tax=Nonomuraea mangrovi TaxID=2316207 RepID=A0ABW4SZF4_9ACTN